MGDLLPFAYPEMVKRIFPETFNEQKYKATVEVGLQVRNNRSIVYGKIAALIKDNTSIHFRVGSMLLACTEGVDELICSNSDVKVPLERSVVVVPSGWVLCIEVDLHVKTDNNSNNLKATLDFNSITESNVVRRCFTDGGDKVHVTVTFCPWSPNLHSKDIGKQLSPPVQVFGMASAHPTIVYTIGDELSFIEFIMALRRILADHQHHEDILDGHRLLNLSSTREHPVLDRQRAEGPHRWIELKLQVVEGNEMSSTTLFMKADNVYVHGFMNQQRVSYELLPKPQRNKPSFPMLPRKYEANHLYWDLKYRTILNLKTSDEVVGKLKKEGLGRVFAKKAVHLLSRYGMASASPVDDEKEDRLALAGLIFMIAESARMNPIFKSFACEWNSNNGFTEQLMRDYAWGYGDKSRELWGWKRRQYAEPKLRPHYPIKELEAIYLVLNTHGHHAQEEENDKNHHQKPDDDPRDGDGARKRSWERESSYGDRRFISRSSSHSRGGNYDGRSQGGPFKRARNEDSSGGPQSQQRKAGNANGSGGDPASKSKEASDGSSSRGPASYPGDGEAGDTGTSGGNVGSAASQLEKTDDTSGGGGGGPANQPSGTDNTGSGSGGGSARQPNGTGDADPSGGNSGSEPREADGAQYNGRPRVELLTLAVRSHLCVVGMTIVVFDGKRGQIIYKEEQRQHNEEQGDQGGWVDLVLTGPDIGITAYGCFVIKIETPALPAPIRWEWDCYKPEYVAQVDKSHVTQHIDDVAKVTYAVMSNAREATVQVKLRLNGGHIPSCVSGGKITALINGFQARSVLFKHAQGTGQCLSRTDDNDEDDSWFLLELARNVVAVPCGRGRVLHIEVDLQIVTKDGKEVEVKVPLSFDNGICLSKSKTDDGNEVEVEVTWYPEIARPSHPPEQITIKETDEQKFIAAPSEKSGPPEVKMVSEKYVTVVYTIGDELSFVSFIMDLRRKLADHQDHEDILDGHGLLNLSSSREHPVLAKQRPVQPARWLHIKLQVVEGRKTSWTTLLMRDDNLYVHGFINQEGVCYQLSDAQQNACTNIFPSTYSAIQLDWGVSYRSILGTRTSDDPVHRLAGEHLGRNFAREAVRRLSSPYHPDDEVPSMICAGVALAGLILMVCESARMNPLLNFFVRGWSEGTRFTKELMDDYVWRYGYMSSKLLTWKSGWYAESHPIKELQAIYLVLNTKRRHQCWKPGLHNHNAGRDGDSSKKPEDKAGSSDNPSSQPEDEEFSDGDASSASGSEETGDSGSSGGNSSGQPGEADDDQCQGRPRVELLSMRADLGIIGTKVVIFDGKRGQIIYTKEEQGEQGKMVDLVLTGPYKGISAYGCFAIIIDIPDTAAGSSSGDAGGSIQWEWDCYDPKYAAQVDQPPVSHAICTPDNCHKVAEVTYAVMSNAREATVQVKLGLKDGHSHGGVSGEVTALIGGFEDKDRSVLFRRAKGKGQRFSTTKDNSWFLLELARNVVAVPCGSALHIEVNLQIGTDDGKEVELKVPPLIFDNGICSSKSVGGNEVEVEVNWYPQIVRPSHPPEQITSKGAAEEKFITAPSEHSGPVEVKMVSGHLTIVYTIGDELSFTEFIVGLRRILADHPDREDILDEHPKFSSLSSTGEHPVLAKQCAEQPPRWIHVKLQVVEEQETSWATTLIMRDDNLYICGFMNQQGDSFELIENPDRSANILPVHEYNPRRLSWGVSYRSLLDADTRVEVSQILVRENMCLEFTKDAVHVLSCFPAWVVADKNQMNPRKALARLIVMVCESARMNSMHNYIARGWSNNNDHEDLLREYTLHKHMLDYGKMSHELLTWKSKRYDNPHPISPLQEIYLVLNYRWDPPQESSSEIRPRRWNDASSVNGRPRVELLAIGADFDVVGTTVMVFDGKRGHIIYWKEDQGEKGMVDLVLTGPCTSISAYGCFAIKIDIPAEDAGSSKGDAGGSIKWEWDCYDPEYADEVDKPPVTRTISCSGPGRNVEVTYVVMSDALEATVQVKMRCIDGNNSSCSVHGNITARIGYFKDRIVLFRRTQGTGQRLSPTDSRVLQLSRSVLAVPSGKQLHIEVDLQIETYSNNRGPKPRHFNTVLDFANGISSQRRHEIDGNEVEVNVTWYPDVSRQMRTEINPSQRQPDISYVIGDSGEEFGTFITELRRLVADHPRRKDVLEEHPDPVRSSTRNHPMLPNGHAVGRSRIRWLFRIQQARWLLHIKLHAGLGVEETPSITLVMRVDTLDIIGFKNHNGDWYDISKRYAHVLPEEYESTVLGWGENCHSILGVGSWKEIMRILNSKSLGKTFAADAVSVLSRFGPTDEVEKGGDNPRLALVGLMVMICESARINPVHDAIVRGWNNGTGLTKQLMDYIDNWSEMSSALLDWKDHVYEGWPRNLQLENIGIKSPDDALDIVHLVRNDPKRLTATTY